MRADSWLARLVRRIAFVGVAEADTEAVRAQKVALTLASLIVTVLAVFWVSTYLALGLPAAAAIPFAYQVASLVTLAAFARSKAYRFFRASQAVLMTLLPFFLQWVLGGYAASSAVSLWALVAAIGTLFFFTADGSVRWFVAFALLTVMSGVFDSRLAEHAAPIPDSIKTTFFVLNVLGVSITAYVLLQYAVRARDAASERSESLLLNVLPGSIAAQLKRSPGVIATAHDEVTVLFADVVDFTPFAERTEPRRMVGVLDEIFSAFDELAARHGLEKIKTIGDSYMVAAGLPEPRADHAEAMAEMALDMQAAFERLCGPLGLDLAIRIGMDSGSVVAGVIGRHKFTYDLWGDTVNRASRMESNGVSGRIQVGEGSYSRLRSTYEFDDRGAIEIKGKGRLRAYLLVGRLEASALRNSGTGV